MPEVVPPINKSKEQDDKKRKHHSDEQTEITPAKKTMKGKIIDARFCSSLVADKSESKAELSEKSKPVANKKTGKLFGVRLSINSLAADDSQKSTEKGKEKRPAKAKDKELGM